MGGTYEFSNGYIAGIAKVLKAQPGWGALAPRLPAEVKQMLEAPQAERWWPGRMLAALVTPLEAASGPVAVEQLAFSSVELAVAPIAMPLVKVTMAVFGSTPDSILSRAGQFAATSMRGVELVWRSQKKSESGELQATYPEPVPTAYADLWRGTLRFVFQLCRVAGTTGDVAIDGAGTVLRIPAAWRPL
jgi:hypothetical protein